MSLKTHPKTRKPNSNFPDGLKAIGSTPGSTYSKPGAIETAATGAASKGAMKRSFSLLAALVAAVGALAVAQDVLKPVDPPETEYHPTVRVYFSPAPDAASSPTAAIIREVDGAKFLIRVQSYSFTSKPIIESLVRAKNRGVDVWVLLDKSNATATYSGARAVIEAGIPTGIDTGHAIAHNKIMVVDLDTVISGSFNFTGAAEKSNAENILILKDPALAARYRAYGREHGLHSKRITEADIRSKGVTAKENRENVAPEVAPPEVPPTKE